MKYTIYTNFVRIYKQKKPRISTKLNPQILKNNNYEKCS